MEFSDKIAAQEAQISALKKELDSYRATNEESETAKETAASTQESYEIVLNIYDHFRSEEMSDSAMVDELLKVNPESLGTKARETYDEMTGTLYPRYSETIYGTAKANYDVANYTDAISNLTKVIQMEAGYDDGKAMLLLARSYKKSGDEDNAKKWLEKVESDYPDLDTSEDEGDAGTGTQE